MNRLFRLAPLFLVLVCVFSVSSFAAPVDDTGDADADGYTDTVTTEVDDKNIIVNVTLPAVSASDPVESAEIADSISEVVSAVDSYSVFTLDDSSVPADDSSLSALIASLFGTYTPRTQTVTEYLSDGSVVTSTQIVPGVAGMDWAWIAGVVLFGLILYCFFRVLGGLISRG